MTLCVNFAIRNSNLLIQCYFCIEINLNHLWALSLPYTPYGPLLWHAPTGVNASYPSGNHDPTLCNRAAVTLINADAFTQISKNVVVVTVTAHTTSIYMKTTAVICSQGEFDLNH